MGIDRRNKRSYTNHYIHNDKSAKGDIVKCKENTHELEIQNIAYKIKDVGISIDNRTEARRNHVVKNRIYRNDKPRSSRKERSDSSAKNNKMNDALAEKGSRKKCPNYGLDKAQERGYILKNESAEPQDGVEVANDLPTRYIFGFAAAA